MSEEEIGEPSKSGGFWARVKANRHAFESVLFEHKALNIQKNVGVGLFCSIILWGMSVVFLYEWLQGRSPLLANYEAQTFSAVLHYVSAFSDQGIWTLLKPDMNSLMHSPPFYYLLYVPILNYVTSDINLAMLIVNSVFLFIIAVFPYLAVSSVRGWAGGLLASLGVLACPLITEAARTPSTDIAVIAFVIGLYCSYMCYKELIENKWAYAIAAFFVLGFYTSGTFWVYTVPLWHPILIGAVNCVNATKFLNVLVPGFIVNIIWYLFFILSMVFGILPARGQYLGFFDLLKHSLPGLGLAMIVLGGISLPWLYTSSYKPYEKRKELLYMFVIPWIVFTFVLCPSNPKVLYPAFMAMPIALAIMMPFRAEKIAAGIFLCIFIANSLMSPVMAGNIPLFGSVRQVSAGIPHEALIKSIEGVLPKGESKAAVFSTDGSLNAESFAFIFGARKYGTHFLNNPLMPDFSSVVLNKKSADGTNSPEFEKLSSEEGFQFLFSKKDEILAADGSKIEVYSKTAKPFGVFPIGKYPLGSLNLGSFVARKVTLGIEKYDNEKGCYSGYVFIPAATLYGGDIYGLRMDVTGLKFSDVNNSPALSDISSVRVSSARLSSYTIESVIRNKFPFIHSLSVEIEQSKLTVGGEINGHPFSIDLAVIVPKPGVIEIRPTALSFEGFNLPEGMKFLLRIFAYRLNLSENPYGLSLGSISMSNGIMEIR